jgi:hypothetical protein
MIVTMASIRNLLAARLHQEWGDRLPVIWENMPTDHARLKRGYVAFALNFGQLFPAGIGQLYRREGSIAIGLAVMAGRGMADSDAHIESLQTALANQHIGSVQMHGLTAAPAVFSGGFWQTDCVIGFTVWQAVQE